MRFAFSISDLISYKLLFSWCVGILTLQTYFSVSLGYLLHIWPLTYAFVISSFPQLFWIHTQLDNKFSVHVRCFSYMGWINQSPNIYILPVSRVSCFSHAQPLLLVAFYVLPIQSGCPQIRRGVTAWGSLLETILSPCFKQPSVSFTWVRKLRLCTSAFPLVHLTDSCASWSYRTISSRWGLRYPCVDAWEVLVKW